MRKHTTTLSAAVLLLVSVLTACANVDGETANKSSGNVLASVSASVSDVTSPPAEVSSTPGEEIKDIPTKGKIYKQKRKQFSEEQLISFFSDTPKKIDTGSEFYIRYESDTEIGFITDGNYFRFYTPAGSTYGSICASSFLEENGIEGYEDETLGFSTREEILEQLKDLLWNKWGV